MNKKGFTLIELVMVIVIIGILAAVAIPKFVSLRKDAQRATCQSDVGAIRSALTAFYAQFNMNNSCPDVGNNTSCNMDSGYPSADQLKSNTSFFGRTYFTDGRLPKFEDITSSNATWGEAYNDTTGAIDMDTICP
ncbi:MAG: type II secretion system protein [Deltaproteobacteria bacterium]